MHFDHALPGDVPDLRREEEITAWTREQARLLAKTAFAKGGSAGVSSLSPRDADQAALAGDPAGRNRFVLCLLAADWACYTEPANREAYAHLHHAVTAFPSGFRLWMANAGGRVLPIGYSAFHPISPATFAVLRDAPQTITSRRQIAPEPQAASGKQYLYLYNISMLPQFHRTEASRALLQAFREDVAATAYRGLAAIIVSPDGKRVIERFGLRPSGVITHDGHEELAYVSGE